MKKILVIAIILLFVVGCDGFEESNFENIEPIVKIKVADVQNDSINLFVENEKTQGYYIVYIAYKINDFTVSEKISEEKFINNKESQNITIDFENKFENVLLIEIRSKRGNDWITTDKVEF